MKVDLAKRFLRMTIAARCQRLWAFGIAKKKRALLGRILNNFIVAPYSASVACSTARRNMCCVCELRSIARIRPDGSNYEVVARGVRNSVGFDWHPETRELWFTDNGRDWQGEDGPQDELNRLPAGKIGASFGNPYCHADGKPDLSGSWGRAFNPIGGNGRRRCGPTQVKGGGINPDSGCTGGQDNFWVEYEWISPSRFGVLGLPTYKPEFWDKIQELDQWTNKEDPVMTCKPLGLPRHGTPTRILQTDKDVVFFYPINADYGGGNNEYRDIPTDGRARSTQARHGRAVGGGLGAAQPERGHGPALDCPGR